MALTLGSLFDGSGGFPLAAEMQKRMFAMKDFLNERDGNYEQKSAL